MDIYNINIQKEYFEKYKYFFEKDKQIDDTTFSTMKRFENVIK